MIFATMALRLEVMRTTILALALALLLPACDEDTDDEFQTGVPPDMSPPGENMMGADASPGGDDGGLSDDGGGFDSGIPGDGGGFGVDAGGSQDAAGQPDGGGSQDAGFDPAT
jgi:hypothetical protein